MTERPRRRRGRPKGSEIDDGKALSQIADILIEGRAQNVAGSVRLLAGHNPSLIRRMQRKFSQRRGQLLSEARGRAERLALQDGEREQQMLRATDPLAWRHEHDAVTKLLDALILERQESLKKGFTRQ